MITIVLTEEQAKKLRSVLRDYDDQGPAHEGYQSQALEDLCSDVTEQIDEQIS